MNKLLLLATCLCLMVACAPKSVVESRDQTTQSIADAMSEAGDVIIADTEAPSDDILAELQAEYQAKGQRAYVIPTGASDGIGVWGYVNCCAELQQNYADLGIDPGYLFHATGSGGTQAGLTVGSSIYGLNQQVWGVAVCDDSDYFNAKVGSDLVDWQHLRIS